MLDNFLIWFIVALVLQTRIFFYTNSKAFFEKPDGFMMFYHLYYTI